MVKIYDYNCTKCREGTERFVKQEEMDDQVCGNCNSPLTRVVSAANIYLDGMDPGFPGAYDKWETRREKIMAEEKKNKNETGEYYPNIRHY